MRGNAKLKFWCEPCDHVVKSAGSPVCPKCRKPMTCMGKVWKPGPKGNRMKHYPKGWGNVPEPYWWDTDAWREKRRVNGKIRSFWIPR